MDNTAYRSYICSNHCIVFKVDNTLLGMQNAFNVKVPWISQFNIFYSLGVDGISLPMIILLDYCFSMFLSSWTVKKM